MKTITFCLLSQLIIETCTFKLIENICTLNITTQYNFTKSYQETIKISKNSDFYITNKYVCYTLLKPVLFMQATTGLDNKTESEVQQSLDELCKDKTTLIVAHQLSTVKHADEIIVLKDGTIVERGT